MSLIRIEAMIESDGVLHITNLPCRKGDRVEAVISLREQTEADSRKTARQRFLTRSRQSTVRSSGPYPCRGDLHERD